MNRWKIAFMVLAAFTIGVMADQLFGATAVAQQGQGPITVQLDTSNCVQDIVQKFPGFAFQSLSGGRVRNGIVMPVGSNSEGTIVGVMNICN